ncbi:MAG: site-specific DNA-methyltransferase [Marinagarivorans sp.]
MPILQWLNKDQAVTAAKQCAYRLLEEVPELSYGNSDNENLLIQGDNLEALKALIPFYAGKVKFIFIDPPYNTKTAFEHYDDNLEHSVWLSLMYPRIELLHQLLAPDGFLCCHIDDSEGAYIKIVLDEIFGRSNYQTTFYNQVRYAEKTLKEDMAYHKQIEYVHIYRKSFLAKPIKPVVDSGFDKFKFEIKLLDAPAKKLELGGKIVEVYEKSAYKIIEHSAGSQRGLKEIWATGSILDGNSSGRFFRDYLSGRVDADGLQVIYKVYGIGDDIYDHRFFTGPKKTSATKGKYYQGVPLNKLEQTEKQIPIPNFYDFADRFGNCRHEGGVDFRSGKKPEHYLQLMLSRFSKPGDLVLDSFLGSGSTAAAAIKMKRRFIGIEIGEQAITHCQPRIKSVVDGDLTGISDSEGWAGGGGFRFCKLGQTVFDEYGCLSTNIKFPALAAHIWYLETRTPLNKKKRSAFLGTHKDTAYYLLYNGILGDRRPDGGNVLTSAILNSLPKIHEHQGKIVIYGESSRLGEARLTRSDITFKQIPYDVGSL